MKILKKIPLLLLLIILITSCTANFKSHYISHGRTDVINKKNSDKDSLILIGPASSITFGFKGNDCFANFIMHNTNNHGYVVVEVDGLYKGRYKITPKNTKIPITAAEHGRHVVNIYKATEATTGSILFTGATGNLFKVKGETKKRIEFIGNSITSGMGNDLDEIPCGTGEWYDQHNAYYSYASVTARMLNADYLLSSVSGIGMYRNWNDEHVDEAIMPDVYEKLYLQKETEKPFKGYNADITCIALGTNDFSNGDGVKPRLAFNEEKYITNYISFINIIYKYSPNTQIVLLNSPMVNGEESEIFIKCLNRVKDSVNTGKGHKEVKVFTFSKITPHGCGYHPEIEDDKKMAAQLAPYLKNLL